MSQPYPRLKPGDTCMVREGMYCRPAKVLKVRRKLEAYRIQYKDTKDINTVSWWITSLN